jgi:DNA-binding NtrC family response regulator
MLENHPCVFVVDDDRSMRESLRDLLCSMGLTVQTFASAQQFLTSPRPDAPGCLVLDVQLPGLSGLELQQELARGQAPLPIIFITGHGDIPMTVRAMKAGAIDFLTKPFRDEDLLSAVAQALHHGPQRAANTPTPAQETPDTEDARRSDSAFSEIIGHSAALRHVLQQVELVAPTEATVLLCGETGTGKELLARAIHTRSARRAHAFVTLNCAAIPTSLLESELFGHEKGAYTGAVTQRLGRFELAHRGTLFLDEIGELPLEVQPKLLRVLQEQEFERLGSPRTRRTDARLIAATNRDLAAMVAAQTFRADLFYRLNVFPIRVPPLRERPDDIPLLVRAFTQQCARRLRRPITTIPADTMQVLVQYAWPGNIRELHNVIERAVILSPGPVLQVSRSAMTPWAPATVPGQHETRDAATRLPIRNVLEKAERQHILQALEETRWVVAGPQGAAARLGIPRSTLQRRIQQFGLAGCRP